QLTAGGEGGSQFGAGHIKVVFDRTLGVVADDNDIFNAGLYQLLHDALDNGLVYQREHLFGHGLGLWQKARTETGCGYDCFSDFLHRSVLSFTKSRKKVIKSAPISGWRAAIATLVFIYSSFLPVSKYWASLISRAISVLPSASMRSNALLKNNSL